MSAGTPLPGTPAPMHRWPGGDGLRLAGDAWGDLGAPLVLLLHGVGQTRHAWRATGQLLADAGYRAAAFDARGHGDSDWAADGDYSRDAMIRDLRCVIATLARRPALVGASMGGATSLVGVGEGGIDASALILVDIAPRTERDGVARVRSFMSTTSDGFGSLEEAAAAIDAYRPRPLTPQRLQGLAKNLRQGTDGRYRWHWDPRLTARPRESDERRVEAARRLALPTLLVRGGRSDVVSEDGAREFLTACPRAEYLNIASAGHMVTGDRNDAFGRAALAFLRRAVPAQAPPVPPSTRRPR
ncbi:MAG: alpha/beta hydrolase [Rubrivivax sp.]